MNKTKRASLALIAGACAAVMMPTSAAGIDELDGRDGPTAEVAGLTDSAPAAPSEAQWAEQQKPLGDLAWEIETSYAGEFSYAYFNEDNSMTIAFEASVPPGAAEILASSGLNFDIVEHVGFDQVAYGEQVELVAEQLDADASFTGDAQVAPTPDVAPGRVTVTVTPDGSAVSRRQAAPEYAVETTDAFDVAFEYGEASIETTGHNRAGGTWLLDPNGEGMCTSSFVVMSRSSSDVGVLTAGHCPTPLDFWNHQSGERYRLDFRTRVLDSRGDAMFLRSSRMMDGWFHNTKETGKPVLEARNAYNRERVCRFGRTTNPTSEVCGIIIQQDISVLADGRYTVGHIDQMSGGASRRGDSGGPVFGGNTAMGVMHGAYATSSYFTRISAALSATNTRMCLNVC